MKDNILIEDFINDIEVNFNTRLDNIEKNSKLQLETLLKEMTEKEKNINDIITIGEYKQKEQYRIYEEGISMHNGSLNRLCRDELRP